MQIPNSTSSSRDFGALVRHYLKPRRLPRQFLVATLIIALVLVSLPLAGRLTPPAQAQITVFARTCDPNNPLATIQIIQGCKLGGPVPEGVLERDVINDLLKLHYLPASDRGRLLGWGRDEIRTGIYDQVIAFIKKNPADRTANEQAVVTAVTNLVKARRVLAATKALDEFNRWRNNCPYLPPDPTKFTYTESPLCGGGLGGLFEGRTPPTFAEFQSYGAYLATRELEEQPAIVQTARNMGRAYGFLGGITATAVAAGVGAKIGSGLGKNAYTKAIFPFAGVRKGTSFAVAGAIGLAVPIGIILFAIAVGVTQGIEVFEIDQIPTKLQDAKAAAESANINLATVIANDNEAGLNEVFAEVLLATFPDFPATTGVPAPQASDQKFEFRPASAANFTLTPSIEYKDWDGSQHTVRLSGGWFVDRKGSEAERLTLSIEFLNAEGRKRVATRTGSRFLISDVSDDNADEILTAEIHYRNWQDQAYVARIDAPSISPVITVLPVERHQEPPAPTTHPPQFGGGATNYNVSHIANISDNDPAEILNVAITSPLTSNGVTLSEFRVDPDGKVFARIQPSCSATDAAFTLRVTDSSNLTTTETINVTVAPNQPPLLAYNLVYVAPESGSLIVQPRIEASDDGTRWGGSLSPKPWTLGEPVITPVNSSNVFAGTIRHITPAGRIDAGQLGYLEVSNAGPIGDYLVRVPMTDSCGWLAYSDFYLSVRCAGPSFTYSAANPTCPGANNGQITMNASGGAGGLLYSIDNGGSYQTSNVFTGLAPGFYLVNVKDANACSAATQLVFLADPPPVTFTTTPAHPTCDGASNGTITVNASGGTGSFTYSINSGAFGPSNIFAGLAGGTYQIAVKDSNGCSATVQTVILNNPQPITFTTAPSPPTCNGASNGQITINASGGKGALMYSKDNGATFQPGNVFSNLAAGSYQIRVKDANNCSVAAQTVALTEPAGVSFNTTPTDPACNGASNGAITVNASGGTNSFTYSINSGGFGASNVFAGLAAGSYQIAVKDSRGCSATAQTVILNNPQPVAFTAATTNPICNGASNGQITVNASGGTNSFTYSINGGSFVSSNVFAGLAAGSYQIAVKDANGCAAATQTVTLTQPAPISFVPANLPNGDAGTAYSAALTVSPAAGSYSFALTNGVLPPGLSFNAGGVITGTPTQNGVYNFRVTASGTGSSAGCGGFHDYQINISGCAPIAVSPATLNAATIGAPFNQTVTASPSAAYNYSVSAGALPTGLSLNAATGAITGTPQQSGSFNFTISASLGSCAGQRNYTMTVGCPTITLPALGNATIATSYTGSIAATPSGSYNYSIISGSLPGGLTLNTATGAITGTPTASGSFSFTIKAQASSGCSGTQSYSLTVGCPAITLSDLPVPQLNTAFNQTVAVTPAGSGYSFAVTAGVLPTGLSLNSATGAVSGTPTVAGAYSFTIRATRFGNCTGSRAFTGTIAGATCSTITLADLPGGQPGQMFNHSVTASPSGSYNYAVTAGSLPAGLTLYGSLGMLFGYPVAAGSYSFTITATGSNNCTGSKQYSLTIGGAAFQSLVFGDFDGDGKADLSVWRGQSGDWLTVNSGNGQLKTEAWGTTAAPYFDVMTPGDYDGDGKMDLAVFRRSTGEWLIKGSKDGAVTAKVWGLGTDVPVAGDYDGDGKTDIAVWRGAESNWYILRSSDGQTETISWGTSRVPYRDVPVAADFDGDGKTDVAVFRQSNGHWYIKLSSDGSVVDQFWGLGSDVPVAADYDGDGKADIAVWRGAETNWYILLSGRSSDEAVQTISWGTSSLGDVPVPGDFDGDGKADVAVWRASDGNWYAKRSSDNSVMTKAHGQAGDTPVSRKPQL